MSEEGLKSTENKKIFIGNQIDIEETGFFENLERLKNVAGENDAGGVVSILKEIVPTYRKTPEKKMEKVNV